MTNEFDKQIEVKKIPVPLQAKFMTSCGIIKTLEGNVPYEEGDVVVKGILGERWPLKAQYFPAKYESTPPTILVQDGRFLPTNNTKILAKRMNKRFTVQIGPKKSKLYGKSGDWLLQYAYDTKGVVNGQIFDLTYQKF